MTRAERLHFIDEQLKGLWPQWTPTEAEMSLWMSVLTRFDYGLARTALQQAYCGPAGNHQRPRPGPFLTSARALGARTPKTRPRPAADVPTQVFVECTEPPPGHPHWRGHRKGVYVEPVALQADLDAVRSAAETMRSRLEHLYGGRWITVVETE